MTSFPFRRIPWLVGFTRFLARVILSSYFSLDVEGSENLPETSAFVLFPKHQRWVDIPLLGIATPRPLYYMAKYELFSHPLSHWFISSVGGIPINRSRPLESRRSLRSMIDLLHGGEGIVVFPEGTYYRNKMGRGHSGLVRMIHARFRIPYIPVGIKYEPGRGRCRVRITYGSPIPLHPEDDSKGFLAEVMDSIRRLSGL